MSKLFEEFDKIFVTHPSRTFSNNYVVNECEAIDTGREVRQLIFKNVKGYEVSHELIKKLKSIYDITCEPISEPALEIVRKDCDGFFVVQKGREVCLNICELKTTPDKETVCEAKNQIIGSYVKVNSLLQYLQSCPKTVNIKGFIIAHAPTLAIKSALKDMRDPKTYFCTKLFTDKEYVMPKERLEKFYHPLKMRDIKLYFIEVPDGMQQHQVDYCSYI